MEKSRLEGCVFRNKRIYKGQVFVLLGIALYASRSSYPVLMVELNSLQYKIAA